MLRVLLNPCATCMRASGNEILPASTISSFLRTYSTYILSAGERVLAVVSAQGKVIWHAAGGDHTPAGRLLCVCEFRSCLPSELFHARLGIVRV